MKGLMEEKAEMAGQEKSNLGYMKPEAYIRTPYTQYPEPIR
jgi:hypothetical protein